MSIEREWLQQRQEEKDMVLEHYIKRLPDMTEEWLNAHENKYTGKSSLRIIVELLVSHPKEYGVSQVRIWAERRKFPFMKSRYHVYGIWVKWENGKKTLIRGFPFRHYSFFMVDRAVARRWQLTMKLNGLVGDGEKPFTTYVPPLP